MPFEPALHSGMLVSAVIVHHHMQLDLAGKRLIQPLEKLQKLLMTVVRIALADDLAGGHFQRGKEGRGAVALVIVGQGSTAALFERQPRLRAIQSLNLALFIDTEHQSLLRRIKI